MQGQKRTGKTHDCAFLNDRPSHEGMIPRNQRTLDELEDTVLWTLLAGSA